MTKVAYIVSCFLGERRVESEEYKKDRLHYLKCHLEQLSSLRHKVTQVIFVFSLDLEHKELFEEATKLIPEDYHVYSRKNLGFSYGAWDHALKLSFRKFKYSILIEDDYAPYSDDFDTKLISLFDDKSFYVCQMYGPFSGRKPHCAISNGMIKNEVYDNHLDETKKGFDIALDEEYVAAEHNQIHFTQQYEEKGYTIKDTVRKYKIPYLNYKKELVYYGEEEGPILIAPIVKPFF